MTCWALIIEVYFETNRLSFWGLKLVTWALQYLISNLSDALKMQLMFRSTNLPANARADAHNPKDIMKVYILRYLQISCMLHYVE